MPAPRIVITILVHFFCIVMPVCYLRKNVWHSNHFNCWFETVRKVSGLIRHNIFTTIMILVLLFWFEPPLWTDIFFLMLVNKFWRSKSQLRNNCLFWFQTRRPFMTSKFLGAGSPSRLPRLGMASCAGFLSPVGRSCNSRGILSCGTFYFVTVLFCTLLTSSPALPCLQ